MKQQGLIFFSNTELIGYAMILFLFVFIGTAFLVYRKSKKQHYEKMSRLPLKDEEKANV